MRRRRTSLPLWMLPGKGFYQYEPLGVVLVIGQWNYPVYLTLGPLIAAVAAGNVAVVKPSEHSPATSAALAELLPRYVDPDAVVVLEGDAVVTQELLAQGVDHAFFTGGPEIGETSSGGVVINHLAMHCLVPRLPFGGVGTSGMGAYHGEWGFQALSHRKAVLAKPAKPDPSLMYPPYSEREKNLMRRFF